MNETKKRMLSMNESIDNALSDRFCEFGAVKVMKNKRYIEASRKAGELYEQLKACLPEESKGLLRRFNDAVLYLGSIESELAYRQGIRDGLAISKVLGGI